MIKQRICIVCPMGCQLKVTEDSTGVKITGSGCQRGEIYGLQQMEDPKWMVTSTMRVRGGDRLSVSIKTSQSIPKDRIFDLMGAISKVVIQAPIKVGDIFDLKYLKPEIKYYCDLLCES